MVRTSPGFEASDLQKDQGGGSLSAAEDVGKQLSFDTATLTRLHHFVANRPSGVLHESERATMSNRPFLADPREVPYAKFARSGPEGLGDFSLNPEMAHVDFEKAHVEIVDLSSFNGRPVYEVLEHVAATYSNTHYLPGIEYLQWLIDNPQRVPAAIRGRTDVAGFFMPGSILSRGYESNAGIAPYYVWTDSSPGPAWGSFALGGAWAAPGNAIVLFRK